MSYWQDPALEVGNIPANSKYKFFFQANDNIPSIFNIVPGCGCQDFRFDKNSKRLHVVYTAAKIPTFMPPEQDIIKYFHIEYSNGQKETITFSGIKTRE